MPSEIDPVLRLLQAVSYPGHGVLLDGGAVVRSCGDDAIVARLVALARQTDDQSAVLLAPDLLACALRSESGHTLAVAFPSSRTSLGILRLRIRKALSLFARRSGGFVPPTGNDGGGSGAPAELGLPVPRARAN